jgi:hypothetical protein
VEQYFFLLGVYGAERATLFSCLIPISGFPLLRRLKKITSANKKFKNTSYTQLPIILKKFFSPESGNKYF